MLYLILFNIWFFLPTGLANLTPILAARIPQLRKHTYPLDFKLNVKKWRILGDHKTIRGLVSGIVVGIITFWIEQLLYFHFLVFTQIIPRNIEELNPILFGLLSGLGALGGDAIESFIKRQTGIRPGKSWFPFDQLDYILGGMLLTSFYIRLPTIQYILAPIIWFLLHLIFSAIGYLLRLKKNPL